MILTPIKNAICLKDVGYLFTLDDSAILMEQEQGFSLHMISAKHEQWSISQIINISA